MIAVAGGYGVGITMRVARAPHAGETVTGGVVSSGHGGKGSNQAVAISRLGMPSALFTAIGVDSAGVAARAYWTEQGVDHSAVVERAGSTMSGFIIVDAAGENRIAIADGVLGILDPADLERFEKVISQADLLLVSLEIPLPVAEQALRTARDHGVRTLLNPAPAISGSEDLLPLADVLTPNRSELAALSAASSTVLDRQISAIRGRYRGDLVITLGDQGALVIDREGMTRIPPVPVAEVVDTTGAGDAFTAALAVALVEGRDLVSAARFGTAAGAAAVGVAEVDASLPTRDRVDGLLAGAA